MLLFTSRGRRLVQQSTCLCPAVQVLARVEQIGAGRTAMIEHCPVVLILLLLLLLLLAVMMLLLLTAHVVGRTGVRAALRRRVHQRAGARNAGNGSHGR